MGALSRDEITSSSSICLVLFLFFSLGFLLLYSFNQTCVTTADATNGVSQVWCFRGFVHALNSLCAKPALFFIFKHCFLISIFFHCDLQSGCVSLTFSMGYHLPWWYRHFSATDGKENRKSLPKHS